MIKKEPNFLFNFISSRTEKASTIFTKNLTFDRRNEILHDPIITAAMVDRITHQSYVINMNGTGYRPRQTREFIREQQSS